MASTASRLDICNMALGFVGTRTIASPNENTPEAIQCALYWDRARRAALRDYPYSFAQRRVRLAEKPLPEVYAGVYPSDFTHAYALPDGCLKVHEVHGGSGSAGGGPRPGAWRVENTGEELVILSRQSLAVADCTFDEESVSRWDELFVMAMARRLAAFIAAPLLRNDRGRTQLLEQLYQLCVPRAEGQDASERGPHSSYTDSWLSARRAW